MKRNLMPLLGLILGGGFWLLDALADIYVTRTADHLHQAVFTPDPADALVRLSGCLLLLGFGFAARAATRHLEEDLRSSRQREQRYRNQTPLGVIDWDTDFRVTEWNPAAERIFGYPREEAIGNHASALIVPPSDAPTVEHVWQRLVTHGESQRSTNESITRQGETLLCSWYHTPLTDDRGSVVGFTSVVENITEQERLKQDVQRLDEQWERSIEFFADPIYLVDLDDTLIKANRAFFEMKGLSPEQAIGKNIMDIMHPEGEPEPCAVCRARNERRDVILTIEKGNPNNSIGKPFEVMLRVIRNDSGEPLGILMGMRDLSRQRDVEAELRQHRDHLEELVAQRTRQLEASNRELEAFSFSVSHDLRAPLRIIDGFSRVLEEDYQDTLDAKAWDCVKRIRTNSQRMEHLINDLLEFSRMARGELQPDQVNLASMARDIITELGNSETDRNVNFTCPDSLPAYGDIKLIRVVLENLLGNAWKYTGRKAAASIELGKYTDNNRDVFFIRDNGAGFNMKYADKLFGAFQRLHSTSEFPGSGVGLATVQRIIHRHGGRVWAEGQPDAGACFFFTLPEPLAATKQG